MKEALQTQRDEKDLAAADKGTLLSLLSPEAVSIHRNTLTSIQHRLSDLTITRDNYFSEQSTLISLEERQVLVDMIVNQDRMNTGMEQKQCCEHISTIAFSTYEKAKYHYKYLVKSGQLSELKRGGRVSKAQPTTRTKRS